jgi:hypothetical protein
MSSNDKLPEVISLFTPDIVTRFAEVTQSRSRYQIDKFVVNQHDTDEMKYLQILLELQGLYYSTKDRMLEMEKGRIKIKRLRATGDEIDELEAQQIELALEQSSLHSISVYREMKHLLEILERFPRYTREQIEENQSEYWHKRMHRQAEIDMLAGNPALAGHVTSLIQMGEIKYIAPENAKYITDAKGGNQ